jgi:hypothetical protein
MDNVIRLIESLTPFITASTPVLVVMIGWWNRRELVKVRNQVEEVHVATNSMKDQLVATTAVASKAEGMAEGIIKGSAQTRKDLTDLSG